MKYTGLTYRPPFEASSLLLQVTSGCSHNICEFCTMYRKVPFEIESMEQIAMDLEEARIYRPHTKRVFLENGDPFVLSAPRLRAIAEMIHERLPKVETITMYASINNIKNKSDKELKELRSLGINELNIGVESGLDSALIRMQKGYDAEEAIRELQRLKGAGMDFGLNVILGSAGSALRFDNAVKTAELVNATQPYLLYTGTIHASEGCPLYEKMQTGEFVENTTCEYLEEEEVFLKHLELENCRYFGLHPSNIVQMEGRLPNDKEKLLETVEQVKKQLSPAQLAARPLRFGEGAVYLAGL